ncbi:hypothetical protein LEP1GSC116_2851 [Leptospira interrogans serovar Icterohaemorrhagiae str. Verdun HP]|nr:hypothetical protein LEP1GSC116_2851 [Leptospira interrogans serovar Icterohaemorrhagiae str. Verdun HP]
MSFDIHGVYNKNVKLTDQDKDKFAEEIRKILGGELPTGIEPDSDSKKNLKNRKRKPFHGRKKRIIKPHQKVRR